MEDIEFEHKKLFLIPACSECNSLASDLIFPTIGAKGRYLRKKLALRHTKVLARPDWSAEEMEDLGFEMKQVVMAGMIERDIIRERVEWRNTTKSIGRCGNCNQPFAIMRPWQLFCGVKCRQKANYRERIRINGTYRR